MRHFNAVTLQFLCSELQCGNATQLRHSMTRPLRPFPRKTPLFVSYSFVYRPNFYHNFKLCIHSIPNDHMRVYMQATWKNVLWNVFNIFIIKTYRSPVEISHPLHSHVSCHSKQDVKHVLVLLMMSFQFLKVHGSSSWNLKLKGKQNITILTLKHAHSQSILPLHFHPPASGVTGGGAECPPPETFDWEIFAYISGKKM